MIGCLRTFDDKQPIIAHYFEFENELKFYNLRARGLAYRSDENFKSLFVRIQNNIVEMITEWPSTKQLK